MVLVSFSDLILFLAVLLPRMLYVPEELSFFGFSPFFELQKFLLIPMQSLQCRLVCYSLLNLFCPFAVLSVVAPAHRVFVVGERPVRFQKRRHARVVGVTDLLSM